MENTHARDAQIKKNAKTLTLKMKVKVKEVKNEINAMRLAISDTT